MSDEINDECLSEKQSPNLMRLAIVVEGGLALVAVFVGWLGFCAAGQPLLRFDGATLSAAFVWAMLGMLPLLLILHAILRFDWWVFRSMRKTVDQMLVPLFAKCTVFDILVLSILAGFGEELFFRWCLQGGLAVVISGPNGEVIALIVASVVFGLFHCINLSYVIITTVIGLVLGYLMIRSGTYLAPALAHALYDFVALLYVLKQASWAENSLEEEKT